MVTLRLVWSPSPLRNIIASWLCARIRKFPRSKSLRNQVSQDPFCLPYPFGSVEVRLDYRSSSGRPLPNVGVCEAQDTCPQHIALVDGLGSLQGRDAVSLCPSQSPRHSDVTVLGSWLGLNAWAPAAAGILEGRAPYLHQVLLLHRLCCCAIAEKRVIHTPATHVSYTHMDPFQKHAHNVTLRKRTGRNGSRKDDTASTLKFDCTTQY